MTNAHSYNPFLGYESKQVAEKAEEESRVPTGTVPEIIKWVGKDKERAQLVLDEEQKNSKPRKGLVKELKDLLNG